MASALIIGIGFIGAPFVQALRKAHPSLPITAYLRSEAHDDSLSHLGVGVVHGTFEDIDKIADLCSKHSIVVNAADSENVALTKAILDGLKRQKPQKPTLLHVSGGGNFFDGGNDGNLLESAKTWNDNNEEDMRLIDEKMKNGACDKLVLQAGDAGDINSFIVCPVGVYGKVKSDIKISSLGVFVTGVSQNAIFKGYAPYLGEGTSVFQLVHINDVVALMILVFNKALKQEFESSPYKQYYVAAGVPLSWRYLASIFAKALHRDGKISSSEPKQVFTAEDAGFLAGFMKPSMRVKGDNARSLGYEEHGPTIAETLEEISFK